MSFQIAIDPNRRAATRFLGKVRRGLQKLFVDNPDISRSQVADTIDVHRSVITRQLNGRSDISVTRVAEIAWAVGYRARIDFEKIEGDCGCNLPVAQAPAYMNNFGDGSHGSTLEIATLEERPQEQVSVEMA